MITNEITPLLWKALDENSESEFRKYARKNYVVGSDVNMLHHPVYLHECYLMNKEAGILKEE